MNSYGHSLDTSLNLSMPEQTADFSYKIPLLKAPLEQYYLVQGGFQRTDLNDTQSDSTTLNLARYWELSSGWQRGINMRWGLDHFTQGNVTETAMLLYPGVSVNRTRSRGGLMPSWGIRSAIQWMCPTVIGGHRSTLWCFRRKTSGYARWRSDIVSWCVAILAG